MNAIIKRMFLWSLAFWCLFTLGLPSCNTHVGQNQETSSNDTLPPYDTIKRNEIKIIVDTINQSIQKTKDNYRFAYPVYGSKDTIEYWAVNGQPVRISFMMMPENKIIWPSFFIYRGKLVMIRLRMASDAPPPRWARETMIYFENGKIVHCEEKAKDLNTGEPVGAVKMMKYSKCMRSIADIEKGYADVWPKVKKATENHLKHILSQ